MSEILNSINWTTIFASGITAIIIGVFTIIGQRYTNRMLDAIEERLGIKKPKDKK